uniref:Reverse transcriptase domain-containing protein n=1 Tax=Angiostrongylus cantonensis TaxID=6313 RepID=A0A0K0D040_ANGCA
MEKRVAPTLAVAFMFKVEAPVIDLGPLLYRKCIDDCLVICSPQEEIDRCFEWLNELSEYIKFTREKPKENWLSFLNVRGK